METIISISEKETLGLGKMMAESQNPPSFLCLYGDLGCGKTVFSKGFAEGLGIPARQIKSPTFTLIRKYEVGKTLLYHCDFYRIQEPDELISSDLEEMFHQKNAIILIEWPERVEKLLPEKRTNIFFEHLTPTQRKITIENL